MQERVDNRKTPQNTVKLLTSTIKAGADEEGLRYCFRVVSPEKIYLLQVSLDNRSFIAGVNMPVQPHCTLCALPINCLSDSPVNSTCIRRPVYTMKSTLAHQQNRLDLDYPPELLTRQTTCQCYTALTSQEPC